MSTLGSTTGTTRRNALAGAATVALSVPLLAACGSDDSGAAKDGGAASEPASGTELGSTADVPVGGGKIYADQKVVITQPAEGDFKGFSSICTHQGCPVTSVDNGTINCTCHGSKFSIEDGSVVSGPANSGLPTVEVSVDGDSITAG